MSIDTRAQLIRDIQTFAEKNGRPPKQIDFRNKFGLRSIGLYRFYFGGINPAIAEAGFEPNYPERQMPLHKSDLELTKALREFAARLHHVPSEADFRPGRRDSVGIPALDTYQHHFGSLAAALRASDIPFNPVKYSLRRQLRYLYGFAYWLSKLLREKYEPK
jgi:hypothetical protein